MEGARVVADRDARLTEKRMGARLSVIPNWRVMRVFTVIVAAVTVALLLSMPSTAEQSAYRARSWQIISHVFPPSTRSMAFRVASCETVGFTDFYNNSSGAADLFQEMPGNDGRIFSYNERSLKLNYSRLRRRDSGPPTWYAARIAYLQSKGGTSWSEWNASSSCWS